jgi:hypothetical protein
MGVLVRKRDGAWWVFRKAERPPEMMLVGHPGWPGRERRVRKRRRDP